MRESNGNDQGPIYGGPSRSLRYRVPGTVIRPARSRAGRPTAAHTAATLATTSSSPILRSSLPYVVHSRRKPTVSLARATSVARAPRRKWLRARPSAAGPPSSWTWTPRPTWSATLARLPSLVSWGAHRGRGAWGPRIQRGDRLNELLTQLPATTARAPPIRRRQGARHAHPPAPRRRHREPAQDRLRRRASAECVAQAASVLLGPPLCVRGCAIAL